jgi:hypothetical protein
MDAEGIGEDGLPTTSSEGLLQEEIDEAEGQHTIDHNERPWAHRSIIVRDQGLIDRS